MHFRSCFLSLDHFFHEAKWSRLAGRENRPQNGLARSIDSSPGDQANRHGPLSGLAVEISCWFRSAAGSHQLCPDWVWIPYVELHFECFQMSCGSPWQFPWGYQRKQLTEHLEEVLLSDSTGLMEANSRLTAVQTFPPFSQQTRSWQNWACIRRVWEIQASGCCVKASVIQTAC